MNRLTLEVQNDNTTDYKVYSNDDEISKATHFDTVTDAPHAQKAPGGLSTPAGTLTPEGGLQAVSRVNSKRLALVSKFRSIQKQMHRFDNMLKRKVGMIFGSIKRWVLKAFRHK